MVVAEIPGRAVPGCRMKFRFWLCLGTGLVLVPAAAPGVGLGDSLLTALQKRFDHLAGYSAVYETYVTNGVKTDSPAYWYSFKKPGWVRLEVLDGKYRGAILRYDGEDVHVKAGRGFFSWLPEFTFACTHPWVCDRRGNGVPQSHWGHLIAEHKKYLPLFTVVREGDAEAAGRRTARYQLISRDPGQTRGLAREELWIDPRDSIVVRFIHYDREGHVLQSGLFREIRLDPLLPDSLFLR
jgi:outer membrane lipoprotein-sorting protein